MPDCHHQISGDLRVKVAARTIKFTLSVVAGSETQGLKDPEAKRKAIGAGFIEVFNDFAKGFDRKPKFLVQVCNLIASSSHICCMRLQHARCACVLRMCSDCYLKQCCSIEFFCIPSLAQYQLPEDQPLWGS